MSTRPAWSDTAQGWHFEEDAQYGARDATASELAGPRQLAVDDLGRLYVSDSRPDVIKVFTRDGKLLRTIGREGAGPGEDVPTAAPAFTGFRVDGQGNVWVMRLLGRDSTRTMFDVFAAHGQWRGPVVAPIQLEQWGVDVWGKDEMFASTVDDDGRPIIKRFRIVK